jgi:hypothetical protein
MGHLCAACYYWNIFLKPTSKEHSFQLYRTLPPISKYLFSIYRPLSSGFLNSMAVYTHLLLTDAIPLIQNVALGLTQAQSYPV